MTKTHDGYFLIADITGYTQYLGESELEHAQETLTALLELLVENTTPSLVISRLAGDAVITYAFRERFLQGQTFVEKIEDTYIAFRKTIERLVLNNTCRCKACTNISNLDLKFFIHFGSFGIQRISEHDELVGSDIVVLHRLLKNSVTEQTGIRAYVLFTDMAIQGLGLEEVTQAMTPHREAYEHLGEVKLWVQNMQPVWDEKRDAVAIEFPSKRIWDRLEADISMPQEQVWDYLLRPEFRNTLIGSDRMQIVNRAQGRIGPGSVYQCYHGDKMVPQTILEWQPFERMIVKEVAPIWPDLSGLVEYRLEEIEEGTRLKKTLARPTGPLPGRALLYLLMPLFGRLQQRAMETFKRRIEEDHDGRRAAPEHENQITGGQIHQAARASLKTANPDHTKGDRHV
jgi:hypothetical protein